MFPIEGELVVVRHRSIRGDKLTLSKVVKVCPAQPKPVVLIDCQHDERCGRVHLVSGENISQPLWQIE